MTIQNWIFMIKKLTGLALILLALALLATVFLWPDFRIARSNTQINANSGTYSSGIENGDRLAPLDQLNVYVQGKDGFAAILRRELLNQLKADPQFGTITTLKAPLDRSSQPVLYVETRDRFTFWTPIFSQSRMTVYIAYATDGDISWSGGGDVVMHMPGAPTVRVESALQVNDITAGLTSLRGYYRFMSKQIAIKISQTLDGSFSNPPMPESQGIWHETTHQK
jgi:hypothetical protein